MYAFAYVTLLCNNSFIKTLIYLKYELHMPSLMFSHYVEQHMISNLILRDLFIPPIFKDVGVLDVRLNDCPNPNF